MIFWNFKMQVEQGELLENAENAAVQRNRRVKISNSKTVPKPLGFRQQKTHKTPKKAIQKQIQKGKLHPSVAARITNCTGFPIEVIARKCNGVEVADSRKSCIICSSNTKWVCFQCRLPFCITSNGDTKVQKEETRYAIEKDRTNNNEELCNIYKYSCFHQFHHCAIANHFNGSCNNNNNTEE